MQLPVRLPVLAQLKNGNLERGDPQEFQNDEDDSDNDQNMDPAACFRKACIDVSTQETEQPQDDENYDDSPQHEITPSEVLAE